MTDIVMNDALHTDRTQSVLMHPENWLLLTADSQSRVSHVAQGRVAWSMKNAHSDTSWEVLLCLNGNAYFGMDGKVFPAGPGTMFVVYPGVCHDNNYPPDANGLEHLWIHLLGGRVALNWIRIVKGRPIRIQEHLAVISMNRLGFNPRALPAGADIVRDPFAIARLRLFAGAIAIHLAQNRHGQLPGGKARTNESTASRVVEAICRHIDLEAGRGITLDVLEHYSGYSKYHLLRMFRSQMGMTIHQYIDKARLKRVRDLEADDMTNSAIAGELGFSSSTAFIRWRRKNMT